MPPLLPLWLRAPARGVQAGTATERALGCVLLGVLCGAIYMYARTWRHRSEQALRGGHCEDPPTEARLLEPQLTIGRQGSQSAELVSELSPSAFPTLPE